MLNWWLPASPNANDEAIICDGAVRSGKTFCLSLSFLLWSFHRFDRQSFAFCGKTIKSLRRNLVSPLLSHAEALGYHVKQNLSGNCLEVEYQGKRNVFYLFGGRDEGSAALIQGVTLAGVLFDEVVLMPRGFVEQALARCSVEHSKFWFNCNPEHPSHWFYQNWILKAKEKNAVYIHFLMQDNPSLSIAMLKRYRSLYNGVFYKRYVEGSWTEAYGAVYPMFSRELHLVDRLPSMLEKFTVSCDYGTRNPTSMGLWGYSSEDDCWYRIKEYFHDSKVSGVVKTDEEYYLELKRLVGDLTVEKVIVDPSAASFIQVIRNKGDFNVVGANNSVLDGIRKVGDCLFKQRIKFHSGCEATVNEFLLYRWDNASSKDSPKKENDHAMDEIRYFVMDMMEVAFEQGFCAVATIR